MKPEVHALSVGDRVRIVGDEPPYNGVVGTIRHGIDSYGRFGVVPDKPVYAYRRGHARASRPIWVVPEKLEREPHRICPDK